ncbi:MAG: substrate-binding domain-containing protein, partial [Eubacteriales bacterium]|nr:substrate-binding domain-containing protein [Eubacteriales bacterium]
MRIKVAVVLLALAVLLTGAVACEKKSAETTVGFVTCNMNDTFQTYVVDAATEKAGELGYKLTVQDAQEDVVRQQDQVDTLIEQGVDYLIVVPVDTSAMAPITKAAQDAKIPLVYVNRNPFGEDQPPADVYYVGSQEIVAGRFQGEELVRQMGMDLESTENEPDYNKPGFLEMCVSPEQAPDEPSYVSISFLQG